MPILYRAGPYIIEANNAEANNICGLQRWKEFINETGQSRTRNEVIVNEQKPIAVSLSAADVPRFARAQPLGVPDNPCSFNYDWLLRTIINYNYLAVQALEFFDQP